jgi:hypothetical protein
VADELTQDELLEQVRKLRVTDVLLATMATVAQLGWAKLEESSRDLPEAKVAIESLGALLPVLEGAVPDDALRDYRQVLANLKLAYAEAAGT